MDGRDTDPKSGIGFIKQLAEICEKNDAHIASIVGRFYAMDRDKRWDRVKEAYDLLVKGKGKQADCMVKAMEESYAEGVTDEFIKPINNAKVDGTIQEEFRLNEIGFRTFLSLITDNKCRIYVSLDKINVLVPGWDTTYASLYSLFQSVRRDLSAAKSKGVMKCSA